MVNYSTRTSSPMQMPDEWWEQMYYGSHTCTHCDAEPYTYYSHEDQMDIDSPRCRRHLCSRCDGVGVRLCPLHFCELCRDAADIGTPTHLVPPALAGDAYDKRGNLLRLCHECAEGVKALDHRTHSLAAILLLQHRPDGLERYDQLIGEGAPRAADLRRLGETHCHCCHKPVLWVQRDGTNMRSPHAGHAGHIVARIWIKRSNLPESLVNSFENVVLMCQSCNTGDIKSDLLPLTPRTLRWLIHAWYVSHPYAWHYSRYLRTSAAA